jgi:hypothetical protein
VIRRRAVVGACVVFAWFAPCARSQDDLWYRLESSVQSVACGQAFEVRITVGARDGLEPEAIDPAALRPLRLRETGSSSDSQGDYQVWTTTYEARVAVAGRVTVEAPFARARTPDGGTVVAFADDLVLDVQDVLAEGDDGALELPDGPWERPFSLRRVAPIWGLGLLAVLGASWFVRRRVRAEAARRAAAIEPAAQVARRHLRGLRSRIGDPDAHGFAADMGHALVTFVAGRAGRPELLMLAREELVLHPAVGRDAWSGRLATALEELDAVKFAAAGLAPDRRAELCDVFEELIAAAEDAG